jgi:hypothetical protein
MANGKVLILLFLAVLLFILFVFPCRNTTLRIVSGRKKPTLDSNIHYGAREAYELFGELKDEGRQLYAWTEITADLIFPIIYSLFLSLLIIYIFQKCSLNKPQQFLAMLPFSTLLFDYGENILIAFMLFDYPQVHTAVAEVASVFTKLKWTFLAVSLGAILFGLTCLAIKSVRNKGKAN